MTEKQGEERMFDGVGLGEVGGGGSVIEGETEGRKVGKVFVRKYLRERD